MPPKKARLSCGYGRVFAAVVTERQSSPAMDFFSSEGSEELNLCKPSVQLYLAQTNSSTYLEEEVE